MSKKRIVRRYTTPLSATPEKVFPLLCPVREYDWIPAWRCTLVHSQSGIAELGCVFTTDFGPPAGPEVWVVCLYEKDRRIGFVKTGAHTTTRYTVSLERLESGSVIQWEQEITSLDDHGEMIVEATSQEVYDQKMSYLNALLDYYLLHGKAKDEPDHR